MVTSSVQLGLHSISDVLAPYHLTTFVLLTVRDTDVVVGSLSCAERHNLEYLYLTTICRTVATR